MKPETLLENLFFTTLYIETVVGGVVTGGGTGFVYQVPLGGDQGAIFLVTNKHVVDGADRINLRFHFAAEDDAQSADLGTVYQLAVEDPGKWFVGHPDAAIDIAVAPLGPAIAKVASSGRQPFFKAVTPDVMLNSSNVAELDAMEQVTFIGYPAGLYDRANYLPIARRGFMATPPGIDYEGKPIFLIDASVFPGSSGSPVLIAQTGMYSTRSSGTVVGTRAILLGVLASVYERTVPVIEIPTQATGFVRDALNLGVVYKAPAIDVVVNEILAVNGLERAPTPVDGGSEPAVVEPSPEGDPLA